ncbi:HD domain-containing protein [Patescibacteria group bacterium]|nr:HD domain-containing protein [Patescibacteria group bacterium]
MYDDDNSFGLDPWFADFMKILTSWVLQRLNSKMQVHPRGNGFDGSNLTSPHISNRRTHTDLVVRISAIIAKALGLNVKLCMAIALGHDVGHGPFGHNSERITKIKHPNNSAVMLQLVERSGKGLNLTWEVVSGIINHSRDNESLYLDKKQPNEVSVVVIADKLAYLFLDMEELVNCNFEWVDAKNIPEEINILGETRKQRTISCINALIEESQKKGRVSFSESEEARIFRIARSWMYKNFYKVMDFQEERLYQAENLKIVLEFFKSGNLCGNLAPEFVVSMLTDNEVNWLADLLRNGKLIEEDSRQIYQLSALEIVRSLGGKEIDHKASPLWEPRSVA